MKITNKYKTITIALFAFMLLTACERTEICYDHFPSLTVSLDWEQEWERDYGMNHVANWDADLHGVAYHELRPEKADWVNMVINKPDGTMAEKYMEADGGKINVDFGGGQTYMFYNGDTEYILLSDLASASDARATATLRSRAGLAYINERHPDQRSTNPPDMLYAAYVKEAPEFGVHDHLSMDVTMQPLVYKYIIRYEFDHGLDKVSLARGALGGMAESVYLSDGKTSDKSSIILYDCEKKSYGYEAQVHSFGVPGFPDSYYGRATADNQDDRIYSLNLEVLLVNGDTMEFNFDITDQMKNQPRGGVITVSDIVIKDEEGQTQSGFQVDVTDWPNHDVIDMPMEVVNEDDFK